MGSLIDWFESLGQYRQLQLIQAGIPQVLGLIYDQFLGEAIVANEQTKREFHIMKCCSLQIKDLDSHYKRMSTMYYKLNGINDPLLKHVFIASLSKEIQPELQRQFTIHQLDITNLSLGKINQLAVNCLERLCEQKEFFKDLMENKQPFKSACKKSHLSIKCKEEKNCSIKKKSHFRKFWNLEKKSQTFSRSRSKKPYRFFRKKRALTNPLDPKATVVLFVKRKDISQEIVQTDPQNQSGLLSISRIPCYFQKVMILSHYSLNKKTMMTKQLLFLLKQNVLI